MSVLFVTQASVRLNL
jgi:hypothetical protein